MRELGPVLAALVVVAFGIPECPWVGSGQAFAQRRPQIVSKNYDVDVSGADDLKVRIKNPPTRFDQKGQPLRYSAEELKELRGDTPEERQLPGFKSDFADLKTGDIVSVSLFRLQPDPKAPDKSIRVPAGQLNGTVVRTKADAKLLTLRVSVAEAKTFSAFPTVGNQNKITLDPRQLQAGGIMVLAENPRDEAPPAAPKKGK